jgi:cell division GTPase FtsZ
MSADATLGKARPEFGLPGRIQAANSRPRSIAMVGLGEGGAAVAQRMKSEGVGSLQVRVFASPRAPAADALATIKSDGDDLHRALQEADMIFVVACRGDEVGLTPVVARIARDRGVQVTAIYLVPSTAQASAEEDETLRTLRSGVHMLVVATDETYVAAMIAALGS